MKNPPSRSRLLQLRTLFFHSVSFCYALELSLIGSFFVASFKICILQGPASSTVRFRANLLYVRIKIENDTIYYAGFLKLICNTNRFVSDRRTNPKNASIFGDPHWTPVPTFITYVVFKPAKPSAQQNDAEWKINTRSCTSVLREVGIFHSTKNTIILYNPTPRRTKL